MQCNTARQRAQKILIFVSRSQQLGRLYPSPRDRSSGNGCSYNFRLPKRIMREGEIKGYTLPGVEAHGAPPIECRHAVRKKASLSSFPRTTYRKIFKIYPTSASLVDGARRPRYGSTHIVPEIGGGAQHHRERWLRRAVRTYRTPDGHGQGPK